MHTTIENETLKVEINHLGAELNNLIDRRGGTEHMWSGDEKFWPRKAPILFPCVGESKDRTINIEGEAYPMNRHGFVRNQEFTVVKASEQSVVFELTENSETLKSYPFKFQFQVKYELDGARLRQTFHIRNTGNELIGFQIGGHPAFAVPFGRNGVYADYDVVFDTSLSISRHLLDENGLYSGETREVLKNSNTIPLSYELFNEDALVFKEIPSKSVWIRNRSGGKRLKVDYEGFPHLGIWSVPGADYVCIEPWVGCADNADQPADFFKKDSLIELSPTEAFEAGFRISIEKD